MAKIDDSCKYTKDHEWIRNTDTKGLFRVGISDFAQASLGDVTFIEMPELDSTVKSGEAIGSIESVKAVSELFAPVSGKIVKINTEIEDTPETLNSAPYQEGWIFEIEISDVSEYDALLAPEAYEQHAQ